MPVTLQSPLRSRERIVGFGAEGTGKSSAVLSIARACPDANFYYLDNDDTLDRLLETDFTDVAEREQVYAYPAYEWEDSRIAISDMQAQMRPHDWQVIDTSGKLWDQVQEWFIEQIFQEDIDDYFLKLRIEKQRLKESTKSKEKGTKSLGAFEGWLDWPVINQTYHKRISRPLLQCPGHLMLLTEAQKVNDDDDKGIKELYGPIGSRPAGQKRTGHIMQTVLFFSRKRGGSFHLTTVKDRGRESWNGEGFGDNFAEAYLRDTAGWQLARY